MTIVTEEHSLSVLLTVISEFSAGGTPLHRAKALKWAGERNGSNNGLNKNEREIIWQQILDCGLVEFDERGYIIKLSDVGNKKLLKFKNIELDND